MIVAPECASPFAIPDTTQASFRDDVATDSDFCARGV